MEMKTPMQELYDELKSARRMCDDPSMEMDIFHTLDVLTAKAEELLNKEKEVMCKFAEYTRKCGFLSDQRGLMTTEELYDETFKTKEK